MGSADRVDRLDRLDRADRAGSTRLADAGSLTGWLALGTSAVGAGLLAGRAVGLRPGACALLGHTGIACPACGLTRRTVELLHGDVATAIGHDLPAVALLALLAALAIGQVAAVAGRPVPWLRTRSLPFLLGGLLGAHWALNLVTGGPAA